MTVETELWRSSDTQLLAELRQVETHARQLEAHRYALIGELSCRGVAATQGYASLARLLMDLLRISRAEANRRITLAEAVTPVRPVTGPDLPPRLPRTAQALPEGELGAEHIEIIRRTLTGLPPEVTPAQHDTAEAALVDAATEIGPAALAMLARTLRARLDQDGRPPTDADLARPSNALRYRTRADGRLTFNGELDPEGAGWFTTVIGSLAVPKPATDHGPDPRGLPERQGDALVEALRLAATCDGLPADGGERPTLLITLSFDALRDHLPPDLFSDNPDTEDGDGDGDEFTPAPACQPHTDPPSSEPAHPTSSPPGTDQPTGDRPERRPDHCLPIDSHTMDDPADRWAANPHTADGPVNGRTASAARFDRLRLYGPATEQPHPNPPRPLAVLDGIGLIDARIARRLACDSAIIPIVLGANSEPLDIGRKTRLIPTAIRRALIARDRGCTFPTCTATPTHCDAHHIRHWANGGPTALHNLTLICGQHHRLLHHSEWVIRIATDGHPEFIPPTYIDPTRQPRRNPIHPKPG